jgi:hypothetical protein
MVASKSDRETPYRFLFWAKRGLASEMSRGRAATTATFS